MKGAGSAVFLQRKSGRRDSAQAFVKVEKYL